MIEKLELINKETELQEAYAKQLRQNILQDAIEGKLTAEWRKTHPVIKGNPDYDAEVLFEEIQKGKAFPSLQPAKQSSATPSAGSNAARNARSKELPPITDDEKPFEIPEGWKWVRLGEICKNIGAGKSILCHERIPNIDEIGIVKTGVCSFGYFKEDESKTCKSSKDWHDEYDIHSGDFLIGRANTLELVGSCVIVNEIKRKLMLSDKVLRINFTQSVNKKLILYFMKSIYLRKQIEKVSTGASPTMKNISQESIKNLVILLPPICEQLEIVTKIRQMEILLENMNKQISQREEYANQLMQSILRDAFEEK